MLEEFRSIRCRDVLAEQLLVQTTATAKEFGECQLMIRIGRLRQYPIILQESDSNLGLGVELCGTSEKGRFIGLGFGERGWRRIRLLISRIRETHWTHIWPSFRVLHSISHGTYKAQKDIQAHHLGTIGTTGCRVHALLHQEKSSYPKLTLVRNPTSLSYTSSLSLSQS